MTTTTYDVHGMVTPFKVKRPLSEREKEGHLAVNKRHSNDAHYALSLLKINGTFAESVDKWYAVRGWVAMGGGVIATLSLAAFVSLLIEVPSTFPVWFYVFHLIALCFVVAATYLFLRDAFTYTHYPMRFNRKNRMVYVWRRDGTVLKAAWDGLYFTLYGHDVGLRDLYVVGHVLADDRSTVLETFALSMTVASEAREDDLRMHFEFYRRYMEQGPSDALLEHTRKHWLPPLDEQRESFWWGAKWLWSNTSGVWLLSLTQLPFVVLETPFRWLAMRTSQIPRWPDWVEAECAVEPGDPWVRDAHRH